MKLVHLGAISTSIVLILGMAMVIPAFIFPTTAESDKLKVLVQIEILEGGDLNSWCTELNKKLNQEQIKSVVFLTGKIAQSHPECVINVNGVDVGSQGYRYHDITHMSDYLQQLSEIQKGKQIIDNVGGFKSKIYKAPYGSTDDNIYSLLSRSEIEADFSQEQQYNLFINGQFLKFELQTLETPDEINSEEDYEIVSFSFTNQDSVESIFQTIDEIKHYNIQFVNPSDLANKPLMMRNY